MLAGMESSDDLRRQSQELERAEAAPYVGLPPSPWWVAPAFGAWFAAYVGAFALWGRREILFVVAMVALSAGVGAFFGWLSRRYGALPLPGRGTPPPEIRSEHRRYGVGALAVLALVAGVWAWVGVAAASAATFVLVTVAFSWYCARYEQAAARVRERLAWA